MSVQTALDDIQDLMEDWRELDREMYTVQYKGYKKVARINLYQFWVFIFLACLQGFIITLPWLAIAIGLLYCAAAGIFIKTYHFNRIKRDEALIRLMAYE